MKVTLNLSIQNDQITVHCPETGFHDEVANLILFDKVEKKIMGIGVSLEEAEQRSPVDFTRRKDTMVALPGYSAEDFQHNRTSFIVHFFSASARYHKRRVFLPTPLVKDKIHLNLTLPGYEQISITEREMFEYMLLKRTYAATPHAKQLTINGREIKSVNAQIVQEQRLFKFQEKAANFLVVGMNLIFILLLMVGFSMLIYGITPNSVWQWAEETKRTNPIPILALILIFPVFVILPSAFLGELLGTLLAFSMLKRIWTHDTVAVVAHNRQYGSKRIKRIIQKRIKST